MTDNKTTSETQQLLKIGAKYFSINWALFSKETDDEALVEANLDKVIWDALCLNPNMSEAFFERHLDKVIWSILSQNPGMSEAFFEKYLDKKVSLDYLSMNPNLSEAFVRKHLLVKDKERIQYMMQYLLKNPNISEAFFDEFFRFIPTDKYCMLISNPNISKKFIVKHKDAFFENNYCDGCNVGTALVERFLS